ncbi:hypothetical protein KM792_14825 [Clostridium tyrobutyricum]|uniref:hypothetical protein n=1 Tax=Clostridium tyrobutyricum TaxID=1519 RepID=UPI001C3953E2|nr:hypothetical protein [Clostridium tyrobutyricum]MBV4428726.1 hypothetical protein [Clostridium tyrobutyricum]MBV4443867.1 hypothetical protein [Clostridium tyrobutyricum]MBV4450908.1 hypothetical protein [Clostridium tyrobutyricum]
MLKDKELNDVLEKIIKKIGETKNNLNDKYLKNVEMRQADDCYHIEMNVTTEDFKYSYRYTIKENDTLVSIINGFMDIIYIKIDESKKIIKDSNDKIQYKKEKIYILEKEKEKLLKELNKSNKKFDNDAIENVSDFVEKSEEYNDKILTTVKGLCIYMDINKEENKKLNTHKSVQAFLQMC